MSACLLLTGKKGSQCVERDENLTGETVGELKCKSDTSILVEENKLDS